MNRSSTLSVLACVALATACSAGAGSSSSDPESPVAQSADAAPPHACHYVKETSTTCPDFSLPPDKTEECIDGADCAAFQSDDSLVAGCDESTLYLDKVQFDGTCADWNARADAGTDASRVPHADAGRSADAGPSHVDSGITPDAAPDSALACAPVAAPFSPVWHPPTGMHQGRCDTTAIDGIYGDCFGPTASQAQCNVAVTSPCGQCIFSHPTDASWSAIVMTADFWSINSGGCVALESPTNVACAQAAQAEYECELAACSHCASPTDLTAYDACTASARANECSTYASSTACDAAADAGPAASCLANSSFAQQYQLAATLFCGP